MSIARAQSLPPAATEAFEQQRWENAISLLHGLQADPEANRLLALAYFKIQDLDAALPALRLAHDSHPADPEVTRALLDSLIADRLYSEAESVNDELAANGAESQALFGRARIAAAQNRINEAIGILDELVDNAKPDLAQKSASLLVELLLVEDRAGQAYEVAQRAIARDPDSFYSFRFSKLQAVDDNSRRLRYILAYKMEYDDNVALLPDGSGGFFGTAGEEDFRQVVTGDLLFSKSYDSDWSIYAEGHLSQSFHQDLDQFDLGSVSALLGAGQSHERWGWRLPFEISHDRYDGQSFRTSTRASPGVYFKLASKFFLHVYGWVQDDDFDQFSGPVDSRSGDVTGRGLLFTGQLTPRLRFRSFVEAAEYDTEGSNWQRDEFTAYAFAEVTLREKWQIGLALRYREIEYENFRQPFLQMQADDSREVYLNLVRHFGTDWQFRSQLSHIKHESNIAVFNHERNVYTISFSRVF